MRLAGIVCRALLVRAGLCLAEQQHVVGKNGIARGEIGEAPRHPDLVALENPGITFDQFHQRAGFRLFGGAALTEAAAAQSLPELVDIPGRRGEIMGRVEVGVHRQIGFDALEPRDHAGERTDMLAEPRHRGARRHSAIAAAGHDQFGTAAEFDRSRRSARVDEFPVAADRTLRAGRHIMLRYARAQQVVTDDVIVKLGAKARGNRLGDFERGELDRALSERVADER